MMRWFPSNMDNLAAVLMTVTAGLVGYVFLDFKKMVRVALERHQELIEYLKKILGDHEVRLKDIEKILLEKARQEYKSNERHKEV